MYPDANLPEVQNSEEMMNCLATECLARGNTPAPRDADYKNIEEITTAQRR